MEAGRLQRLETLFAAVRDLPPNRRAAFLEENCGTEHTLRADVEALLAQHDSTGGLLDGAAAKHYAQILATTGTLTTIAGTNIGHYKVLHLLGAGGMGEVWLAKDTRLGRNVALKLLPNRLAANLDLARRLTQEARAASALNHPNILTVHDVGEHEGHPYVVSEYVEGSSLRQKLKQQMRLSLSEVVDIASQVADGLSVAHRAGIVHRDIKPENIMIRPDARVKVLDFGIAKRLSSENAGENDSSGLNSTVPGAVLGTVGYLSPEQARGQAVDARSDLWSLGVVVYEMVTGRQPFAGETLATVFDAILNQPPPPMVDLRPDLPTGLERIARKALEKEPAARYQDATGLETDLRNLEFKDTPGQDKHALKGPASSDAMRHDVAQMPGNTLLHRRFRFRVTAAVLVVAVIVIAVIALTALFKRKLEPVRKAVVQSRITFNSAETPVTSFAVSGDGKLLAYSEAAGIQLKLRATGEARLFPKPAEGSVTSLWEVASWLPDGSALIANLINSSEAGSSTWILPVIGPLPRKLRENILGLEVSPDGSQLAFTPSRSTPQTSGIWATNLVGGSSRKIVSFEKDENVSRVHWSPDGLHIAFIRAKGARNSLESCELEAPRCVTIAPPKEGCPYLDFYWSSKHFFYAREDAVESSGLWQAAIDARTGVLLGTPSLLTSWRDSSIKSMSGSPDGNRLTVLKQTQQVQIDLGELLAGRRLGSLRALTSEEASAYPSAWMPDSKTVLIAASHLESEGIFTQAITEGSLAQPFVVGSLDSFNPRLSPDGKWIVFLQVPHSPPYKPENLMRIPVGGGVPELIFEVHDSRGILCGRYPAGCVVTERSPDQSSLYLTSFSVLTGRGRLLQTIPNRQFTNGGGGLSHDGSTVAFVRTEKDAVVIGLVSLTGGPTREIRVRGRAKLTGLDWTNDDQGFYCGFVSAQSRDLVFVNLRGDAKLLTRYRGAGGAIWAIPSPDGKYLAILNDSLNSNVWELKGF